MGSVLAVSNPDTRENAMPPFKTFLLRPLRARAAVALSLLLLAPGCAAGAEAMAPPAYAGEAPPASMAPEAMPASDAPAQAEAPAMAPMAAPGMPLQAPADAPSSPAPARAKTTGPQGAPAQGGDKGADIASANSSTALIIYQGALQMTVEEEKFPATLDSVIDIAESVGGHLAGRQDNQVEIRVPSARFRETLTLIDKLGGVTHRSVTAQDVSEEFHDAEVRLQNLRATRKRLEEFLAKAGGMQDLLTLEHELERIAQEIDRLEGRMRFLRERAAFSQIVVSLQPKPKPEVVVATPAPPPPPAEAKPVDLPVDWFSNLGIGHLLDLH